MSKLENSLRSELQALTQARLTLGPRGRPLDTAASLRFSLDHATAREAVLSKLDIPRIEKALTASGIENAIVSSTAQDRDTFIQRPDLGRRLPDSEAQHLAANGPVDVALVLGDGLSAIAVALNGPTFIAALTERLAARGLTFGKVICAQQARVALGDGIAQAIGATTVVMALGERPGLSAADSLGVYITHLPHATTQDSARNCISNIREKGTSPQEAAEQAEQLIMAMRKTGLSGVELSQARSSGLLENKQD